MFVCVCVHSRIIQRSPTTVLQREVQAGTDQTGSQAGCRVGDASPEGLNREGLGSCRNALEARWLPRSRLDNSGRGLSAGGMNRSALPKSPRVILLLSDPNLSAKAESRLCP